MENISAVYKIVNTVTGDFYIGSSNDVKRRLVEHKRPSSWKHLPNSPMYYDMQKYGVDKFDFQILEEVEIEQLKEKEQQFIEKLKPTYNNINAKGRDVERQKDYQKEYQKEYRKTDKYKEYNKEYRKSDKYKEYNKEYRKSEKGKERQKEYRQSEKGKETRREYRQSEKGKEAQRKSSKKYYDRFCSYNGETLTLYALSTRFRRAGIPHPTLEAKKYLEEK